MTVPTMREILEPFIIANPSAGYKSYKDLNPTTAIKPSQFDSTKHDVLFRKARGKQEGHGTGTPADFVSDKKLGELDFYEVVNWLKDGQRIAKKASWSQDFAKVEFPDATGPICILPISDTHLGSWCTDYELLETITREIVETPNLYIMLVGDLNQMAIKLRGVAEVSDNAIKPEMQDVLVEKWLDLFLPKVLCASWDNHAIQRQENQMGYSPHASMLKRKIVYFPHIGHLDLVVGKETYKIALSHRFRGASYLNPVHAQARYMRFEGQDREICVQGDTHTPGMSIYYDGPRLRMAINCGTTQSDSTFGKRYFSLFSSSMYPCFVLHPDKHEFDGYRSVGRWRDGRP